MIKILFGLTLLIFLSDAYRILVVFPFWGKSHIILGDAFVRNILAAGHEVTYITPAIMAGDHPNLRQLDVSSAKVNPDGKVTFHLADFMNGAMSLNDHNIVLGLFTELARRIVAHEDIQKLINDPEERFDLVVAEWLFSDLYSGFSAVFECPFVWFSSLDLHWMVSRLMMTTGNPEYDPDSHSKNVPPFTFYQQIQELLERFENKALTLVFHDVEVQNFRNNFETTLIKKGRSIPSYDELTLSASLMIINSYPPLSQSKAVPPNHVYIGGYHIESELQPLSKDLQGIMDNSKNGFIYFSMGSNLNSTGFPMKLQADLLKMFGDMKKTILWKHEAGRNHKTPNNVYMFPWSLQQGILAHSNCDLFITHGGALSVMEAVHFGVPIIGIPVFADQFANIAKAEQSGFGKTVELTYNLVDDLRVAIDTVVNDSRYKEKIKSLSAVFRDRPLSPREEMVRSLEYAIRTKGSPHLHSPTLIVSWGPRQVPNVQR